MCFWPFLNPILAIVCVKRAKIAPLWGLEGSKISFSGPKPTQDPMNNVFEQKKSWRKIFSGPRDPRPKIFSVLARPVRVAGGPIGGQNRSVGVSKPSKTVGQPQGVVRPVTPPLAKVMPKTRFLASVGGCWPVLGPGWGRGPVVGLKILKNPKFINISCFESFGQFVLGFSSILKGLA